MSISDHKTWPLAIAAPPWGKRTQKLLIEDRWLPPAPLDCPSAIRDSEARRVFAAHQRCSGTTYVLVSPGIGFRTSKDLEYFREELMKRNWLDAAGTPIKMIAAHELLNRSKAKTGKVWDANGVKELAQILNNRSECSYVRLITAEELEANGFSFQVSRYLHSEGDLLLQRYLDSRTTMQLGDLAEIGRPVASLGRQEEDGIEVREVTPSDIDDSGQLHQGSKRIRLPESALAKGRQQRLEPGDVLLSIKGGLGRVAVVQDLECPTVPGQGTAVAFVPMGEVKSRPVGIPHPSELQRAEALQQESVALRREIEELSRKLQRLSCQGWMQDLPPALLVDDQGEAA